MQYIDIPVIHRMFSKTVDSSKLEKRNGTVYQVGEKSLLQE